MPHALDIIIYLLAVTTICIATHQRKYRQTDDRIYFEDDLQEYKNRIKTENNFQTQTNEGTRLGAPQKVLFVPAKVRSKRQFDFGPGGFNDIGQYPPRPNDEDDLFIWGVQRPEPNGRPQLSRPTLTTPATTLPGPPTWATSAPLCIRNCRITPEYNPVCGTDLVTYTNPGRLRCAQRCGKSIEISFYGACMRTQAPTPSTTPRQRFG